MRSYFCAKSLYKELLMLSLSGDNNCVVSLLNPCINNNTFLFAMAVLMSFFWLLYCILPSLGFRVAMHKAG